MRQVLKGRRHHLAKGCKHGFGQARRVGLLLLLHILSIFVTQGRGALLVAIERQSENEMGLLSYFFYYILGQSLCVLSKLFRLGWQDAAVSDADCLLKFGHDDLCGLVAVLLAEAVVVERPEALQVVAYREIV